MLVLGILLGSWVLFRLFKMPWRDAGRWALAVMLLFTASAHFTSSRHDLVKMVPDWVPEPMAVIYLTGVLEIAGAIGILIPRTRPVAGVCLCLLFLAMFPANVKADREGVVIAGNRATPLVLRAPMQALFIWLAWWSTRRR